MKPNELRLILGTYYFEPEDINSGYEAAGSGQMLSTCQVQNPGKNLYADNSGNCVDKNTGDIYLTMDCYNKQGTYVDSSGICYNSDDVVVDLDE